MVIKKMRRSRWWRRQQRMIKISKFTSKLPENKATYSSLYDLASLVVNLANWSNFESISFSISRAFCWYSIKNVELILDHNWNEQTVCRSQTLTRHTHTHQSSVDSKLPSHLFSKVDFSFSIVLVYGGLENWRSVKLGWIIQYGQTGTSNSHKRIRHHSINFIQSISSNH